MNKRDKTLPQGMAYTYLREHTTKHEHDSQIYPAANAILLTCMGDSRANREIGVRGAISRSFSLFDADPNLLTLCLALSYKPIPRLGRETHEAKYIEAVLWRASVLAPGRVPVVRITTTHYNIDGKIDEIAWRRRLSVFAAQNLPLTACVLQGGLRPRRRAACSSTNSLTWLLSCRACNDRWVDQLESKCVSREKKLLTNQLTWHRISEIMKRK